MRIEITKRPDGAGVLRCVRHDGSVTYQKQSVRHAGHFAFHDLTHLAVETELGLTQGFFGLIDAGWDIEDTTGKTARGELPPEAVLAEQLVGLFDAERGSGTLWTVDEFNSFAPRVLTEDELSRVRKRRAALFHEWVGVAPGGTLTLQYGRSAV